MIRRAALVALALLLWATPAAAQLSSGLVSCWTLDEASGNRADSVGGHTLTDTNSVPSATGKISTAAGPFGTNRGLDGGNILGGTAARAFALWVKIASTSSSDRFVFSKGSAGTEYNFGLYLRSTGAYAMFGTGNTFAAFSGGSWNVDTNWHHLVTNYDGAGTWTLYLDGSSVGTASETPGVTITPNFMIGNLQTSLGFPYDGLIDEFAAWSRTLSGAEVTSVYNSGSGLSCASIAGGGSSPTPHPCGSLHLFGVGCEAYP